ncbi:MAG: LLM class flavin-dependent oxidoreductase [Chloroflexi bacterium]|nr:LLM class flavin-dependent oxidoreductase [Chloroflexota bacterium]
MKFSTFHLFPKPKDWPVKQVYEYESQVIQFADELGFDCSWVAEHHFRDYGVVPNSMVLFANLAAKTKRIRLGNAIMILPFQHPLRVAEDAAMVDIFTDGRLNFGFGRGYQSAEFTGFGVSMDDTRERTDEALDIILKAWSCETFSYHGKYYNFEGAAGVPAPVQKPHPPVYVASINPASIRHYAPQGIPFIVSGMESTEDLENSCKMWREIASEHGHDLTTRDIVCSRPVFLADTNEEAKKFVLSQPSALPFAQAFNPHKEATTEHERYSLQSAPVDPKTGKIAKGYEYWEKGYQGRSVTEYQTLGEGAWEERWVAGDLERVVNKIKTLESIGVGNMICSFGIRGVSARPPLDQMHKSMERFAREVMPHFA